MKKKELIEENDDLREEILKLELQNKALIQAAKVQLTAYEVVKAHSESPDKITLDRSLVLEIKNTLEQLTADAIKNL